MVSRWPSTTDTTHTHRTMHLLLSPLFASGLWIGGGSVGLLLLIVIVVLLLR